MRVLVAAWIGSTNLGDELIARSIFEKLQGRGATVTTLSVRPASTRSAHGIPAVSHLDPATVIRALRRSDRLVFGGGGLLQDESSFWNVPYQVSRLWLARLLGVPAAAVGIGATGLSASIARRLTKNGLAHVRSVAVRDAESAQALMALGIREVIVAADPAFALPVPDGRAGDNLVICLRPSLAHRKLVPVGMRKGGGWVSEHWLTSIASALDEACMATGLRPRFVAMQTDRDHDLHAAVAERMASPAELVVPSLDSVLDEIATGTVVVAMRYHAAIGAVLAGRPTLLISYSSKMDALAVDLGSGVELLPNSAGAFSRLASEVSTIIGRDEVIEEAREKLRHRERGNDTALDLLLEGP